MSSFAQFNLDSRIMSAIERIGYKEPTPIQLQAIPVVMKGGDVMGAAQTGTGKTASFGLPLIARILPHANTSMSPARHPVRALILTPTRELADQVSANMTQYAADTPLRVGVVYGGVDIRPQSDMLRRGVEILTATPGRLLDHIEQRATNLSQVEVVVLDEADRMLDMGFLPDISRILKFLPANRQSLMFSATFSPDIARLAKNFLKPDPFMIEVARQNQTADTVTQEVFQVADREKTDVLIDILKTRGPENKPLEQVIVFVNAKITCRRLARTLERVGINADAIHGDKTQAERRAPSMFSLRPTSRHEVWTSRSCPASSTMMFRSAPRTTCTASAVPVEPVPTALPSCSRRAKTAVLSTPSRSSRSRPSNRSPCARSRVRLVRKCAAPQESVPNDVASERSSASIRPRMNVSPRSVPVHMCRPPTATEIRSSTRPIVSAAALRASPKSFESSSARPFESPDRRRFCFAAFPVDAIDRNDQLV